MDDDWNITRKQGKDLIIRVFEHILMNRKNVNEHELCIRMSSETNHNNIYLYRGTKRRNLNNFMKVEFDGLHKFIKENEDLFDLENGIIRMK